MINKKEKNSAPKSNNRQATLKNVKTKKSTDWTALFNDITKLADNKLNKLNKLNKNISTVKLIH